MTDRPATGIESLVLDAAPLLVQARIAGLADKYYIPASVVAELRDARARDYLHTLHTTGQIDLEVREPDAEALKMVMEFAKQTGDYAVLSKPDLHVLALTYALEVEAHGTWRIRQTVGGKTGQQLHEERRLEEKRVAQPQSQGAKDAIQQGGRAEAQNDVHQGGQEAEDGFTLVTKRAPRYHVTDDEDDERAGEWITPDNIVQHKNKALGIVTEESSVEAPKKARRRRRGKGTPARMSVACMTGDFAVQNVLLQMGLYLVSVDGARIERVKSWVLRCHACYRICKDPERKFCPSCGNAALLRTSVTTTAGGHGDAGTMQVHLKPNFQYRNRGTVYALPMPKPGSASGGRPSGQSKSSGVPILREDQLEWQRAVARQKQQRQREERALQRQLEKGQDSLTARYADPDWVPDLLSGTHSQPLGELPAIGIGRKNPNERRRRRR